MSGAREPVRLFEAAIIALDDAARQASFDVEQYLARAQVYATLAGVEQARIANLIAWKQLRQSAPATALAPGGDLITVEIERALGITDPEAAGTIPERNHT